MGRVIREKMVNVLGELHFRFFWQLIVAFLAIILLAGGGVLLAGGSALHELMSFASDNPPAMMRPWIENLAHYYERQGSWEGVDSLIAGFPCGVGWESEDQGWYMEYVVAAPDGVIVAASDSGRVGRSLRYGERVVAIPIAVNEQMVGRLILSPYGRFRESFHVIVGFTLQRFLLVGLAIGGVALVAGWGFSRVISQPVVKLTEATRAVAAGDLSVRVREQHPGELGELAMILQGS